jgi:hypothetical protein
MLGTGEGLAWPVFREHLKSKVPSGLLDVLAGMDEIVLPAEARSPTGGPISEEFLNEQIRRVCGELKGLNPTFLNAEWQEPE